MLRAIKNALILVLISAQVISLSVIRDRGETINGLSSELNRKNIVISDSVDRLNEITDELRYYQILAEAKVDMVNSDWSVEEFKLTGYAPLDPGAIEGMCYSGDPSVTRTGAPSTPGLTIAVDPEVIPLGSPVWIEGLGWRLAHDTGGAVKGDHIDVMYATRGEALSSNRKAVVLFPTEK